MRARRKGLPASGRKQAGRRVARLNSAFSAFSRSSMCSRGSAYLSDTTTNQLHTTCGKTNNAHETQTAARPSPPKAKPCTHEHPRASAECLHAGPHARSLDSGGAVTRSVAKARVFVPFVCLCAELSRCGARPTPSSSSHGIRRGWPARIKQRLSRRCGRVRLWLCLWARGELRVHQTAAHRNGPTPARTSANGRKWEWAQVGASRDVTLPSAHADLSQIAL